jgi:hypothetical protein
MPLEADEKRHNQEGFQEKRHKKEGFQEKRR